MIFYIFITFISLKYPFVTGKSIGMIAEAVSTRSSKEENNLLAYLETERMRAEERERIRQEEYRIRQEERADERRREDHRFNMQMQMMMVMMKPQVTAPIPPFTQPAYSQSSQTSSQGIDGEFDGQSIIELELLRRTTGV